jgi:hypothetical protein
MHRRFHFLAAIGCAWLAGLLVLAGSALSHGFWHPRDPFWDELWMLGLVLGGFTCATVIIGAVVGFSVVRLLEAFRLYHFSYFFIASIFAGGFLGLVGAAFFLVCVSEPGPRSFTQELSFMLPHTLIMSMAGFLSYWWLRHRTLAKA